MVLEQAKVCVTQLSHTLLTVKILALKSLSPFAFQGSNSGNIIESIGLTVTGSVSSVLTVATVHKFPNEEGNIAINQ